MGILAEIVVAKSKRGRPAKNRPEVTARIELDIMNKVKWLASLEEPKVTIGEYLSEVLRPIINKRHQQAVKRVFGEPEKES